MKTTLFLLKNTPEDLWAAPVDDSAALHPLQAIALGVEVPPLVPALRVLVAYTDQLHRFVQHVPSLAWELLEYADEPLEIVYPQKKPTVEGEDISICVRWVKQPKLLRFLMKTGPLWASPVHEIPEGQSPAYTVVDCLDKHYPYQRVRTMVINRDETFTFLR